MTRRLLILLTIVLLVFTGAMVWMTKGEPLPSRRTQNQAGNATGQATIGGAFTLTDQNGGTVKDTDFRGRLMLVFFGFTHCPDLCPTTMATLTKALGMLPDETNAQLAPIFITVDPERDTPPRLKEYLANYFPGFTGLTGPAEQVGAVEKAYKVYAAPQGDTKTQDYQMDHSGFVYLMDRDGIYITHFSPSDTPEGIAAELRKHLQ